MSRERRTRGLARAALLLVLALGSGCSSFAVSGGLGLGVGAEVRLSGLLHTGLLAYMGFEGGSVYGERPRLFNAFLCAGVFHFEESAFKGAAWRHTCFGLLPGLISEGKNHHPWAFEVSVALLFCHLRVGWDPTVPWRSNPDEDPEPSPQAPLDAAPGAVESAEEGAPAEASPPRASERAR